MEGSKGGGGRGEKARENPANDSYACRTKRGDERVRRNAIAWTLKINGAALLFFKVFAYGRTKGQSRDNQNFSV